MLQWSHLVLVLLVAVCSLLAHAQAPAASPEQPRGWFFPFLGAGRGTWDASVGLSLWPDHLRARNLQLRGDVDLAPGVRWHTMLRSNREFDTLNGIEPHFDENYLEGYGQYHGSAGELSASLRIGNVRYLHTPYPDAIALFDQVPGVEDLLGRGKTGYSGEILQLEYAHPSGLGAHYTGIHWDFGREGDSTLEGYGFYRRTIGDIHLEARAGQLAMRRSAQGESAPGVNAYLGYAGKRYHVGVLYEKLHQQPTFTGVLVTFPSNTVTRALGAVAFDYDRNPEGFALQVPLVSGKFGGLRGQAPEHGELVGEITAARLRTYWQNGQVRNYYEHRLRAWGDTTSRGLVVVEVKEPWYLQAEALVSPHASFTSWDDLRAWERDRQGPAQLQQQVVYRFYRVP